MDREEQVVNLSEVREAVIFKLVFESLKGTSS